MIQPTLIPRAEVFRDAAELIDDRRSLFCCSAITAAGAQDRDGPENRFFAEWFRPEMAHRDIPWWGCFLDREEQEARVLALLFAALLVEDEFSS